MANTDVFVIGGGPAGLAAAIAVRLRGFRVMLADCFRPPIDKACGEGLMPDSLAALQSLGIDSNLAPNYPFRGIRFLGSDSSAAATFPAGDGIGIRRTMLHQLLVRRARDLGVEMHWGARISGLHSPAVMLDGGEVHCRWIIGADGQNSQVRSWAGLSAGRVFMRRLGLRQHFRIGPWSEFVEIYWGKDSQIYITPVATDEICVAVLSRRRIESLSAALHQFPALVHRLRDAPPTTQVKGAATVTRRLRNVCRGSVALLGDASGSTDALTGEGLTASFRQAIVLADAMAADDLRRYHAAHRRITAIPLLMGRAMLLMDGSRWLRLRALRAFARKPALLQGLLAVHVGCVSLPAFGARGAATLGWELLKA